MSASSTVAPARKHMQKNNNSTRKNHKQNQKQKGHTNLQYCCVPGAHMTWGHTSPGQSRTHPRRGSRDTLDGAHSWRTRAPEKQREQAAHPIRGQPSRTSWEQGPRHPAEPQLCHRGPQRSTTTSKDAGQQPQQHSQSHTHVQTTHIHTSTLRPLSHSRPRSNHTSGTWVKGMWNSALTWVYFLFSSDLTADLQHNPRSVTFFCHTLTHTGQR